MNDDDLTDRLRGWGNCTADGRDLREAAADEIDRLRDELHARAEVSSDVNSDHAREIRMRDDEIDRLRATIAALLAVPEQPLIVEGGNWFGALRARMAAVVEGER